MFEEKLIAGHDDDDTLSDVVVHEMVFCFRAYKWYFAFNSLFVTFVISRLSSKVIIKYHLGGLWYEVIRSTK